MSRRPESHQNRYLEAILRHLESEGFQPFEDQSIDQQAIIRMLQEQRLVDTESLADTAAEIGRIISLRLQLIAEEAAEEAGRATTK